MDMSQYDELYSKIAERKEAVSRIIDEIFHPNETLEQQMKRYKVAPNDKIYHRDRCLAQLEHDLKHLDRIKVKESEIAERHGMPKLTDEETNCSFETDKEYQLDQERKCLLEKEDKEAQWKQVLNGLYETEPKERICFDETKGSVVPLDIRRNYFFEMTPKEISSTRKNDYFCKKPFEYDISLGNRRYFCMEKEEECSCCVDRNPKMAFSLKKVNSCEINNKRVKETPSMEETNYCWEWGSRKSNSDGQINNISEMKDEKYYFHEKNVGEYASKDENNYFCGMHNKKSFSEGKINFPYEMQSKAAPSSCTERHRFCKIKLREVDFEEERIYFNDTQAKETNLKTKINLSYEMVPNDTRQNREEHSFRETKHKDVPSTKERTRLCEIESKKTEQNRSLETFFQQTDKMISDLDEILSNAINPTEKRVVQLKETDHGSSVKKYLLARGQHLMNRKFAELKK